MDQSLIVQVMTVSGLAALAFVMLRADGPFVLALAGLVVAVAAVGLVALVRLVVVSERERLRR